VEVNNGLKKHNLLIADTNSDEEVNSGFTSTTFQLHRHTTKEQLIRPHGLSKWWWQGRKRLEQSAWKTLHI
jgi:hypothetical protein